jgi:ribonucleoside-diphosphate reductase alpha chain
MFDVVQLENGTRLKTDPSRDDLLTDFGKATLSDRYLLPGETFQDLFARVAVHYSDDSAHAQRLYDYISKLWFMPSTPVLSNGGTSRGLPISCFLNEANDSLHGIVDLWNENVWLAARGGGIGSYWGNLRSIGEKVGGNGKTSGIVPFIRVQDSLTLAISQGSLRRGSAAVYLPISHPEIEEFIELRRPTGGDPNRKALNLHNGVTIPDAFMRAVEADAEWALTSPKDGSVIRRVSARSLWIRLLTARIETGEPYMIFIDHVNRAIPDHHKLAGLEVKMSNLCSEITLPTGADAYGKERTAVCCLSSLNLEKFLEWQDHPTIVEDVLRFLDNVLSDFIANAPDSMSRAKYAAERERSIGLGVMGFHSFLQGMGVPFESVMAKVWNRRMFQHIRKAADAASVKLALERGACPDAADYGIMERFSNKIAIAPTASISIICGGTSPGIEPLPTNAYTHKTLSGSFPVRNPHLEALLAERDRNNEETWSSIVMNGGSVQHLDILNEHEKMVFKTAFELDQRWVIELAADRTPFVCQSQSLNVFIPADVHKRDLHQIHFQAWKQGVKSLYYCRSMSIQRAESAASAAAASPDIIESVGAPRLPLGSGEQSNPTNYEECLSCQ